LTTGFLVLDLAFIAGIVSTASYLYYYRIKESRLLHLANFSFAVTGFSILVTSILLLVNILNHNYQLNYVYQHSSSDLNRFYLVSTFWAGQQGTFLLWLLYGTIFGVILIKTTAKENPMVLFFHMLVQCFILLILLKKNPFAYIWQVHPEAPVGFMPTDGSGLNPLLQNPWMVIHPPTLFNGYSSTMVAFSFAMAAMVTRDFKGWIKKVQPWVIYTVVILGAGIVMGGYWAYTTLGWGGYWGWDPVKNSSLVPWLISVALLHGLVIQGRQKGLVKTNLFLAGFAFLTVLWGSFLTRSGVLADFSVHSFAESDLNLYLIAFFLIFTILFLVVYFRATRGVKGQKFSEGFLSREMFVLMGVKSFMFTGIFVLVGTSSPIYTPLFGKASNVSPEFYNNLSIPVVLFILASVSLAPLLSWKVSEFRDRKTIAITGSIAVIATILGIAIGLRTPSSIVLFFLAVFAICNNVIVSYKIIRKNVPFAGGYLAHIGLGFMIVGIITSSVYDRSEKINLPEGEFIKTSLGYEVKFTGFDNMPDGKDRARLEVRSASGEYEASPRFYYSDYNKSYMASPDVRMLPDKDIYISPVSFVPAGQGNQREIMIGKGETKTAGDFEITFHRFDVKMTDVGPEFIKALLTIKVSENNYSKIYDVVPELRFRNGQQIKTAAAIGETGFKVKINSVNATAGTMNLLLISPEKAQEDSKDILAVEISEKPLIGLLWFGTILVVGGAILRLSGYVRKKQ